MQTDIEFDPHTDTPPRADAALADIRRQAGMRGKLRIYFGAAACVGKTHAMLVAARALQDDGLDVVVGVIETHTGDDRRALLDRMHVLPLKIFDYRGDFYSDFDLDAALVRRPALLVVDALAHTNAPGLRHRKRWQDVEQLRDAGIDVFTTVQVQDLESLTDAVGSITGIRVLESLPDAIFDAADEVVLVDVPVDEWLARLQASKRFEAQRANADTRDFFRKGNLIALRTLALRRITERSGEHTGNDGQADRIEQSVSPIRKADAVAPPSGRRRYSFAAGASLATALITLPLLPYVDLANIAMLFLLTVVLVSVRFGRRASVVATLVGAAALGAVAAASAPSFSFAVNHLQYALTFFVMLTVGLITGQLTANLRYQAGVASHRESRSQALYEFARALSGALQTEQIFEITRSFIQRTFQAQATLLLPDDAGRLQYPRMIPGASTRAPNLSVLDMGVAQWAFDQAQPAGAGTATLTGSSFFYLPLVAPMRTRGILAIQPDGDDWRLIPEQKKQLDTFAALAAIALERVHYIEVAQDALVRMESERLRNSLLAALSHDLRTPLTSLVGISESLAISQPPLSAQQSELAYALRDEALRMSNLVSNLLDMARIQNKQVKLNLQWQPLEEVVGSALRASRAALVKHAVQTQLASALPLVRFDAVLIERVLCNLLENAAKYTPPGSNIAISGEVIDKFLRVQVTDDGPGVPSGREEAIFEKFTRGERESAKPGVGLGLSICRAIVEAHGGTICVTRSDRPGAAFVFTLLLGTPPELPLMDEGEDNIAPERS